MSEAPHMPWEDLLKDPLLVRMAVLTFGHIRRARAVLNKVKREGE